MQSVDSQSDECKLDVQSDAGDQAMGRAGACTHCLHTRLSDVPGTGLALPTGQPMHAVLLEDPASGLYVPALHCSNVMLALVAPALAQ